jgi:hypothetical protein
MAPKAAERLTWVMWSTSGPISNPPAFGVIYVIKYSGGFRYFISHDIKISLKMRQHYGHPGHITIEFTTHFNESMVHFVVGLTIYGNMWVLYMFWNSFLMWIQWWCLFCDWSDHIWQYRQMCECYTCSRLVFDVNSAPSMTFPILDYPSCLTIPYLT